MDETPVLVELRAGYRVLTLNRPQRLNAFTEGMHRALAAALAEAEADTSCRALLLPGAGRGFCAGKVLGDRPAKPAELPLPSGPPENNSNPPGGNLPCFPFPAARPANGAPAGPGAT